MFDRQIPLKSIYRELIDFRLEANSNNYIQAGWHPVGSYVEFMEVIQAKKVTRFYRVGWLRGAGEPIHPPIIDEVPPPRIQDFGPSEN
jgi:hypothetical protein